jgi:hypothetical protein
MPSAARGMCEQARTNKVRMAFTLNTFRSRRRTMMTLPRLLLRILSGLILCGVVLGVLGGCQTASFDELVPRESLLLTQAKARAIPCQKPEPARQRLAADWKYGCFCGRHWPDLSRASSSDSSRRILIAKYYRIKPYDAMDEVCQAHDVCWVLRGDGATECNNEFVKRLTHLRDMFLRRGYISAFKPDRSVQCAAMANDIAFAPFVFFEGGASRPETPRMFGVNPTFIVLTPFYVAVYVVRLAFRGYPPRGDRCGVPSGIDPPGYLASSTAASDSDLFLSVTRLGQD